MRISDWSSDVCSSDLMEAAVIKGDAMKRLNANKRCHGVVQLNFSTRTFFLIFQYAHPLWLKDIAPGYDEVGRRRSRRGLFDQDPDFSQCSFGRTGGKNAVARCLFHRYFERADQIAADIFIGI